MLAEVKLSRSKNSKPENSKEYKGCGGRAKIKLLGTPKNSLNGCQLSKSEPNHSIFDRINRPILDDAQEFVKKTMKNELYFPIRSRKDGSLYTDKSGFWKTFWCETLFALLAAVVFLVITLLILTDPFNICAPVR